LVLKIFNSEALDDRLFVKMVRAANVNSGHGIDLKKLLKHSIFLQNEFEFGMILKFFPRTCVLGSSLSRGREGTRPILLGFTFSFDGSIREFNVELAQNALGLIQGLGSPIPLCVQKFVENSPQY
jgi:hypothetical protein